MAKKKTFQEYTKEALYEIEKTEAALKQAKLEKEQAEHRIQRSLNYLDTQKKKKRKARTHLLIQKGAAIEAVSYTHLDVYKRQPTYIVKRCI